MKRVRCKVCGFSVKIRKDDDPDFAMYLHEVSKDCKVRKRPGKETIEIKDEWDTTGFEYG